MSNKHIKDFFRKVMHLTGFYVPHFKIFPRDDGRIKGRAVFVDTPIRCRLCGRSDGWYLNDTKTAFICDSFADEHEPTPAFGGYIHTLDSVSTKDVESYEIFD